MLRFDLYYSPDSQSSNSREAKKEVCKQQVRKRTSRSLKSRKHRLEKQHAISSCPNIVVEPPRSNSSELSMEFKDLEELDADIYDRIGYLNLMNRQREKERRKKFEHMEHVRRFREE
ncbi:hypothetical protein Ddc_07305 [Ditylenchus destructor]|nr:hypothetical protein Ddc_07305 [Ditylenchus destructor]